MKTKSDLMLWRAKHYRDPIKRPWHWCFFGLWFLIVGSGVTYFLLAPSLHNGAVLLPVASHLEVQREQSPTAYWCSVAFYSAFVIAAVCFSIGSFRCAALLSRCIKEGVPEPGKFFIRRTKDANKPDDDA